MQPSEKIAQIISEMHALIQFCDVGSEDANLEAMKCEIKIEELSSEASMLTSDQIKDAARRGVQRVTHIAQA